MLNHWSNFQNNSTPYGKIKKAAEFVNCTCHWGLFRGRNITMRKPKKIFSGESDISLKGCLSEKRIQSIFLTYLIN